MDNLKSDADEVVTSCSEVDPTAAVATKRATEPLLETSHTGSLHEPMRFGKSVCDKLEHSNTDRGLSHYFDSVLVRRDKCTSLRCSERRD